MAKSTKARYDCRALIYLEPVALPPRPDDLRAAFLNSGSNSPARRAVEARSDLTVLDDIVDKLLAEGVEVADASSACLAVLTVPTVAARRKVQAESPAAEDLIQSILLATGPEASVLQVVVHLRAVATKPGALSVSAVEVGILDLADRVDEIEAVRAVERWWTDFPMPNNPVPEPFPLQDWACLGDPTHSGIRETPPNWRNVLDAIGGVYGVKPLLVDTAGKLHARPLEDLIDFGFTVAGTKWAADFPPESDTKAIDVEQVGINGETFGAIADAIRSSLLEKALVSVAPPARSRDLERGEFVYHRKVGGSKKFDHFDAGSATACIHGADNFIPWHGPKATKGMARRYDNFTPDMLIHCAKKMQCGMYGVDAARGGLKTTDETST